MPRIILLALAAALLLLPATADGHSGVRLRGIVTVEDATRSFVTVSSARRDHVLRVQPASLDNIRLGMRVELRGSTLRRHGNGSRVLSRGVILVRSDTHAGEVLQLDDDEIEVKGTLTSLSPLRVTAHGRVFTCAVPAGVSLAGFHVGDFVEMECDLVHGAFVLRELELEDDDDDRSGPGDGDDDDDDDDDNSGPGSGDDEDDDDNSGPGGGDDDD
jgi:hypothetical protein